MLSKIKLATLYTNKSPNEVLKELAEMIPQERDIMLTAGEQLIQQSRLEERQSIARSMLAEGVNPQLIKRVTHFSDEELARLAPNRMNSAITYLGSYPYRRD
jgi:predicted transposase YdaD